MVEPTIHMEAIVTHIELHRVLLDTMDTMDMAIAMARGLLMLDMAMAMDMELLLSMSPRLTMDMATTLPITTMVTVFTRGLQMLSQDMVMPALLSTKAVLTTMDPTDMVSSIMARDPLMLDIMDTMDTVVLVTSKLTDLTLTMVSVWHILTTCG